MPNTEPRLLLSHEKPHISYVISSGKLSDYRKAALLELTFSVMLQIAKYFFPIKSYLMYFILSKKTTLSTHRRIVYVLFSTKKIDQPAKTQFLHFMEQTSQSNTKLMVVIR